MAWDNSPYVELTGRMIGPRGAAWHFEADFLDEPIFIPKSQCRVVEQPEDGEGRCTVYIRAWIARKEGWNG